MLMKSYRALLTSTTVDAFARALRFLLRPSFSEEVSCSCLFKVSSSCRDGLLWSRGDASSFSFFIWSGSCSFILPRLSAEHWLPMMLFLRQLRESVIWKVFKYQKVFLGHKCYIQCWEQVMCPPKSTWEGGLGLGQINQDFPPGGQSFCPVCLWCYFWRPNNEVFSNPNPFAA